MKEAASPQPPVKKRRLLRELQPTSMTNKSLKDLKEDCRSLKLPISGTKPELKARIRDARSGQTTIKFTPSKRKRPDHNLDEDREETGIGTPKKNMKGGGKESSKPVTRAEGREGPTPAATQPEELCLEKSRGTT